MNVASKIHLTEALPIPNMVSCIRYIYIIFSTFCKKTYINNDFENNYLHLQFAGLWFPLNDLHRRSSS